MKKLILVMCFVVSFNLYAESYQLKILKQSIVLILSEASAIKIAIDASGLSAAKKTEMKDKTDIIADELIETSIRADIKGKANEAKGY